MFTKINKNYLGKDLTLTEHYVLCVFQFVLAFLHLLAEVDYKKLIENNVT